MKRLLKNKYISIILICLLVSVMVTGYNAWERPSGTEGTTAENFPEEVSSEETSTEPAPPEEETTAAPVAETVAFSLPAKVLHMYREENYPVPVTTDEDEEKAREILSFESDAPEIVAVDEYGMMTALREGSAVITCRDSEKEERLVVNVYNEFGSGNRYSMKIRTGPGEERTFINFCQGAYDYEDRNEYIAWHGCAACCGATILTAFEPDAGWTPDRWINELEKEEYPEAWERNYSKSMSRQMPVSLYGISRVFEARGIPHTYVTKIDENTADDLRQHLAKGEPVVYLKGKNGYHTMLLLGLTPAGEVLVSNPGGTYRVYTRTIGDVIDQMISCKEEPDRNYFPGRAKSGGYIKVYYSKD